MKHGFIQLEDDKIINLDKVSSIVKNKNTDFELNSYVVIIDGLNSDLSISQKDYDTIKNCIFGFHPDYDVKNSGNYMDYKIHELLGPEYGSYSVRIPNAIYNAFQKKATVRDIVSVGWDRIKMIRGLGESSQRTLRNALEEIGISIPKLGKKSIDEIAKGEA